MCNFAEEIEDMANEINNSKRDLTMLSNGLATSDSEYVRLVSLISDTWEKAISVSSIQHEIILCAIPKNPNSVWTIDLESLFGVAEV
jgi:hypothetical protein